MAKTILLPQTTFTAEDVVDLNFYAYDIPDLLINEDKINVVFDDVKYEDLPVTIEQSQEQNDYYYGGDATGDDVDFSVYPFVIQSSSVNDNGGIINTTYIFVQDGNEHTIEIYTGEDEPVVTVQKSGVQVLQLDERLIIFDETTGDVVTFDGENWQSSSDNFGEAVMPSKYAVVGTAIVGKDVVAPGEKTKTVIIPETSFTGVESGSAFRYRINDLLIDEDSITVVFDGVKYENIAREYVDVSNAYGSFDEHHFEIESTKDDRTDDAITDIYVQDGNEHTIEVYIEE